MVFGKMASVKKVVLALAVICIFPTLFAQDSGQSLLRLDDPDLQQHAYILTAGIWLHDDDPSKAIPVYVCWENPSSQYEAKMQEVRNTIAATWHQASRIDFVGWEKCADINRGIRILIDDSGPVTKKIGQLLEEKNQNGVLAGIKNGMVLNLTFMNWGHNYCQQNLTNCIKAVAVHEFGHGLGFVHEQNRPDAPGECLKAGPYGDHLLTPYDKASVMNYCNLSFNNGGKLSQMDISGVQQVYGKPLGR
jgi:hypothetical protein